MPHAAKSLIDIAHDLGRGVTPAELKQLLPNVARIAVDDRLRDTAKQLVDHGSLVLFGNSIKRLLDNMAAKGIHAEIERITTDGLGNCDDLIVGSMLEAALNKEVAEAVDH